MVADVALAEPGLVGAGGDTAHILGRVIQNSMCWGNYNNTPSGF